MGLKELQASKNFDDMYRLARYMYRVGIPIMSDQKYDELEKYMKAKCSMLVKKTYDDDTCPTDLFLKYGITLNQDTLREINAPKVKDNPNFDKYREVINDFRTNSINPLHSYEEIYNWFKRYRDKDIVLSLKVDGVNTRSIVEVDREGKGVLACSSSRAKKGEGWDITENLSRKFPKNLDLSKVCKDIPEMVLVYGEAYTIRTGLEHLRNKYNRGDTWKTPRSTGLSMLRVALNPEDYQYLKFKVFKVSGLSDKLSETLTKASELGFDVVPWELVKAGEVPENFGDFSLWLQEKLEVFGDLSYELQIESDGVVAELDNQEDFSLEGSFDQYSVGNIAMKVDTWGSHVYTSKIKSFYIEGQRGKFSFRANIEPVKLENGNTATWVNCFNLDIIIKEGLVPGGDIIFEYKSSANINLVRSKSLDEDIE